MPPADFRTYHLPYRLYRLRRRIVVFSALPLLGAGMSIALHPENAPLADPVALLGVMSLWTLFMLWHHAAFPGGWAEALPMTVMATGLLATTGDLTATASAPALADPRVQLDIFRLFITFTAGTFLLVWLLPNALVNLLPRRTLQNRHSSWVPVPSEALQAAMVMHPGDSKGHHRCGVPDSDGYHPVWVTMTTPNEETFEPENREYSYKVRLVENEDGSVIQHTINPADGSSSMSQMRFSPEDGGTRYEIDEVHDSFNDFHRLLFWLDDFQEDYLTAIIDEIHQRPPRAIKQQCQDIMLSRLAGWIKRNEFAEPR